MHPWNVYTQQDSEVDKVLNPQDSDILKYFSSSEFQMKQKRGGLIYKVVGVNEAI